MDTKKSEQLVIKDQTIIAFYKENPNLNIVTMNHIFIDILKKLSTNLNETITNNINHKILSTLTDLSKDIVGFKQDITTKLHETKKEYIDNVKLILENSTMTTNDKIQYILEKNGDAIVSKTTSIINEIVPKHNDKFFDQIELSIKNIYESINQDTNKLIENINKDDKGITEFINNIDAKFNSMIVNMQQPIFSFIQSSEERTSNNVQQIRDKLISQQMSQDSLNLGVHEFLNKYKHNSSSKGNVSEYELYSILQIIFPSDEIIDCSGETSTCDYRVNRLNPNKPSILFENKDYSRSVTTEEIKKFERDLKQQKMHGIFISHKSNITYKEPFQIDIIDNLIHIYLPNTDYSVEKIKIAVEIIDTLSTKLIHITTVQTETTTINITKDDIDELLDLFNDFNTQKISIIDTIKTTNKQVLDKIENMQLNSVKKILNKNGVFQSDDDFKCKHCNAFTGKNKASLGAHIRNCKFNPINNPKSIGNIILNPSI
jgi:dissimilatory sulfite reductase (desulfoviridin) alpha/beta subunit